MTYLSYTWGGNDNATGSYGTYDIYCEDGYYPAARAIAAGTYPVWVVAVGANVVANGGTAATGNFKLGGITTNGIGSGGIPVDTDFANAALTYDGITGGGKLVYSGSARTKQRLTWVNTSTWGCWAGRSTSTSYTTYFGTSAKDGQMGGGVRYYLAPSEPTAVSVSSSTTTAGKIDITWTVPAEDGGSGTNRTATSEINAYSIYRSTSSTGTYSLVSSGKITDTVALANYSSTAQYVYGKFTDTTATPGTAYYYKVAAHNLVTDQVSSTTTGVLSAASSVAYAPAVPDTPTITDGIASDTNSGTITIVYSATVPTGSPAVSSYDIYRDGVKINASTVTSTVYVDSTATPGTFYDYTVIAKNSIGSSSASTAVNVEAPGAPAAPASISVSKSARNVTVTVTSSSNDFGKSVTGYYVQYQSASTEDGTYSAWSTPVLMTSLSYTYTLMNPATWYKFRSYAKNSITRDPSGVTVYYPDTGYSLANFVSYDTQLFVAAGGKRLRSENESNPGTFQATETVKRFDGAVWKDIQIAKRFDGTDWVDLG
jgi:hypothetical protein